MNNQKTIKNLRREAAAALMRAGIECADLAEGPAMRKLAQVLFAEKDVMQIDTDTTKAITALCLLHLAEHGVEILGVG